MGTASRNGSGRHLGNKVDAFVDTFGGGYVELAFELGVAPDRIDTIIDFTAAANAKILAELPDRCRPPSRSRSRRSILRPMRGLLGSRPAPYTRQNRARA